MAADSARAGRPRQHTGTSAPELAILDATEAMLATGTLHDIRVHRILEAASVSRASFYFYFQSKEAVVAALLARVIDEHFQAVHTWLSAHDDPRAGLRKSLIAGAQVWSRHRSILKAVAESWHGVPELQEMWREAMQRLIVALQRGIDQQRSAGLAPLGRDSRELAAALIWGGERTFYIASLELDPGLRSEYEAAEILYDIWSAAIYGGSDAS
jgi:TetR/AcrR family transcriptional regulator, ethionamide resistance regulator